MAEALTRAGRDPEAIGPDRHTLDRIGSFVELHVEQGRALVDLGQPVAVGTDIWPHGRWRLDFPGEANHAGTTRLEDRRDAMLGYARAVLTARSAAQAHGCLATMGKVVVQPGGVNAIPSAVTGWLDARGADEQAVRAAVAQVAAEAAQAGAQVTEESWTPTTPFDADLAAPPPADPERRSAAGNPCSAPARATTPASSPTPASRRPCCSSAIPRVSPTRHRSGLRPMIARPG